MSFARLLLPLLLLGAFGCRERNRAAVARRTDALPATSAVASRASLLSGTELLRFKEAVTSQWGADLSVLRVEIWQDRAELQLRAPNDPAAFVSFVYTGSSTFEGPFPLTRAGSGNADSNLFGFASVDWSGVPGTLEQAKARVDPQHGEVSRLLVRRNLPHDDSVGLRVYVGSPYRDSHVDADARGRLLEAGRYP